MAPNTPCSESAMAAGCPGRFTISDLPRTPAVWRDRIAVGVCCRPMLRRSSPNPGSSFSITPTIASGVRSRGDGPVPPVVKTSAAPSASHSSISAVRTVSTPSGTMRRTIS